MKDKLLKLLQENNSRYISGETLSNMFNVSRTAIWKQINTLKKDGYTIESVTNKGYRLIKTTSKITASGITASLKTQKIGKKVICLDEVGSTNDYAKSLANEGLENGTVIVAEKQNKGKGRLGRTWSSVSGKGIWMTIFLRPTMEPQKAQTITLAAAVAVVKALKPYLGDRVKVKWPNDVLVDGKKICGILTEMSCELENINYIIVGPGVNINHSKSDFPEDIIDIATSLKIALDSSEDLDRVSIIADILKEFEELYLLILNGKTDKVIDNWRSFSTTLGKQIQVKSLNSNITGIAEDITEDGVLLLKDDKGNIHRIFSGEILIMR